MNATTPHLFYWPGLGMAEILAASQVLFTGTGLWGVLLFAVIFVILQIFMAPSAPFILVASVLFGFWQGLGVMMFSMILGLVVLHGVSRSVMGRWFLPRLERNRHFVRVSNKLRAGGGPMIFLLRINPLFAFSMVSYLTGILRLPLRQVLMWSPPGLLLPVCGWLWVGQLFQNRDAVPDWVGGYWLQAGLALGGVLGVWLLRLLRKPASQQASHTVT